MADGGRQLLARLCGEAQDEVALHRDAALGEATDHGAGHIGVDPFAHVPKQPLTAGLDTQSNFPQAVGGQYIQQGVIGPMQDVDTAGGIPDESLPEAGGGEGLHALPDEPLVTEKKIIDEAEGGYAACGVQHLHLGDNAGRGAGADGDVRVGADGGATK